MFVRVYTDEDHNRFLWANLAYVTFIEDDGSELYFDGKMFEDCYLYGIYSVVEEDVEKVLKFLRRE